MKRWMMVQQRNREKERMKERKERGGIKRGKGSEENT